MCLIIHKKPDVQVPLSLLKDAFIKNNDGWGIMYVDEKTGMQVFKGFEEANLLETVDKIDPSNELFIHLRMATHGDVDYVNCHPFQVGKSGVLFMHNGVITTVKAYGKQSDTSKFCDVITPLVEDNPEVIFTEGFKSIVNTLVGGDRLVFLTKDGRHVILGEGAWHSHDSGCELSNTYAWSYWESRGRSDSYYTYSQSSMTGNWNRVENVKDDEGNVTSTSTTTTIKALPPATPVPIATASKPATTKSFKPIINDGFEGLPSELFTPKNTTTYGSLQEYQFDMANTDSELHTLDELLGMEHAELDEIIWGNPNVAVNAIYNYNRSHY